MLFEFCEAFVESGKEEQLLLETNVENDMNGLEVVQGTPDSRRKRLFVNRINGNDQKPASDLQCSSLESMHDALPNDENYSSTNKEEISNEDISDEDIHFLDDESNNDVSQDNMSNTSNDNLNENNNPQFFEFDDNKEDQLNEAIFANAINVDMEETMKIVC